MVRIYWVLVNAVTGVAIPPQDNNPLGKSQGLMVYPDIKSAEASCVYQKDEFEIDCKPVPLGNER